jgi:hypothetical protein
MNSSTNDTSRTIGFDGNVKISKLFIASIGCFDDTQSRAIIDELVKWVEFHYRDDLLKRPSKHVYLRKLPDQILEKIDQLRSCAKIHEQILRQFPEGYIISPMRHTDELYISHYNKDYGGDQGLYDKHYDGNLRFLSYGSVVRALIYLQSDATYKVVFHDSRMEKAFVTYDFGLLDFHRELHWVEGEYNPDDQQRILLKCNYLITPRHGGWAGRAVSAANTAVFYLVKAAMEYSKSPSNPAERVVGLLCNIFRLLNNIHPVAPLALIAAALGLVAWLAL